MSSNTIEMVAHKCYNDSMKKSGSILNCEWCGDKTYKRMAQIVSHKHHYCSQECRIKALNHNRVPWNKGTVGVMKPNSTSFKKGQRASVATEFKRREHVFKGTLSEYKYIHYKVGVLFGKLEQCENCGKDGLTGRKIHWANITGVYDTNRSNWRRLCVRCHAINDERIPNGKFV